MIKILNFRKLVFEFFGDTYSLVFIYILCSSNAQLLRNQAQSYQLHCSTLCFCYLHK